MNATRVFGDEHDPKRGFFRDLASQHLSLTFDDITLRTGRTNATGMPHEVSIHSRLTRNVSLLTPIASAAMDTVTEYRMAIALAMEGGIGVIHRSLPPKEQAAHVARVKYFVNGLIDKPICCRDTDTVASILKMREQKRYPFHSFPIIDESGRLTGVVSRNDFEFCTDHAKTVRDIMTTNAITVSQGTKLDEAYAEMLKHKVKILPVVNRDNHVVGLYVFSDLQRILANPHPSMNVDERGQLRVAAAIGTDDEALERIECLAAKNVDVVVIDTAHADSEFVFRTIRAIKSMTPAPRFDLLVGNISEPESAKRLADAGVDGIKVGQGPGSICTTRKVTGVGRPQVSAVYECADAVAGSEIPICADGGIRYTGDIPIAIGAGAHTVMLGSMLAGCDETPGDKVYYNGRQWKRYRGMGSLEAMIESAGARHRYGESATAREKLVPEGISGLTPYTGAIATVIHQCVGGLRKSMWYVGATCIEEMRAISDLTRTTAKGDEEGHPHDVVITEESPNYQGRKP